MLFTIYLGTMPVMIFITGAVDENTRAVFMACWECVMLWCGQLVLLVLYNPNWMSTSFPFHANTPQQLGIIAELARATEMTEVRATEDAPPPRGLAPRRSFVRSRHGAVRGVLRASLFFCVVFRR